MTLSQQNPDGTWSPAEPLPMLCEKHGCEAEAVVDIQRGKKEPTARCTPHAKAWKRWHPWAEITNGVTGER